MSSNETVTGTHKREHFVGRRIGALGRMARTYADKALEPYGIGYSQALILVTLWSEGDGVSQLSIGKRLHIDKSAMTRNIRPLVEAGYIQRLPDPADERAYRIMLTDRARAAESEIRGALQGWARGITAGLSDEEYAMLDDVLSRVTANAERMLCDQRSEAARD